MPWIRDSHVHGYIAARSKAEAIRLGQQAWGPTFTKTELYDYWSEAKGSPMRAIEADEPGVWLVFNTRTVWHLVHVNEQRP